jgi:hypothetical protein
VTEIARPAAISPLPTILHSPGNTVMWRRVFRLTDIALIGMVGSEIVGN